jgi:hypothetical protein
MQTPRSPHSAVRSKDEVWVEGCWLSLGLALVRRTSV